MTEPNIVLAFYNEDKLAHQQFIEDGSPIKRFARIMQMESVAQQFLYLLNDQDRETNLQKSHMESEKKKVSIGERIKNKLQSTNNKSRLTQPNNRANISEFHFENVSTPDSLLYNSNSERANEKQLPYIDDELKKKLNKQDKVKMIKSIQGYLQKSNQQPESFNESPLQNISAKTHKSSPNIHESIQQESPSTPIDNLNNISGMATSQNRAKVLNFHSCCSIERQVAQFKVETQRKGQQQERMYKIRVKNVALASSQQLESPASAMQNNQYEVNIMNVESMCIPCQSNCKPQPNGYEYAMQQLQLLKTNVQQLQRVADSLSKLTRSSDRLPSQIMQNGNQNRDQQNESLYQFFQQNLKGLLHQSSSQTILIDNNNEGNSTHNYEENRKYVYETPNQQWGCQNQIYNQSQNTHFSNQQVMSNKNICFDKQVQEIEIKYSQQLFKGRCKILQQISNGKQQLQKIDRKQKSFLQELDDSNEITFMARNKQNECPNYM